MAPVIAPECDQERAVVSFDCATGLWTLEKELWVQGRGWAIRVPAGYKFDGASVPRPAWWAIARYELSNEAPSAHDFLYGCQGKPPADSCVPPRTFTRKDADEIFNILMARHGVPRWRRLAAYWAVRAFGWWAWHQAGKRR